jgi:outer membrane cobalamin receptor
MLKVKVTIVSNKQNYTPVSFVFDDFKSIPNKDDEIKNDKFLEVCNTNVVTVSRVAWEPEDMESDVNVICYQDIETAKFFDYQSLNK